MFRKIVIFLTVLFTLIFANPCLAHQPIIVGNDTILITTPEISRAFYGELSGIPQRYFVTSTKQFDLFLNLLVPFEANPNGRYSAKIYDLNNNLEPIATIDGTSVPWSFYYETFAKDYYYKGPEFDQILPAGRYAIDVYSGDNQGKYILAIGKIENFSTKDTFTVISTLRDLKVNFFNTSPFQLALTIFGLAYFLAIFVITLFLLLIYKFILHHTKSHSYLSHKTDVRNKIIRSAISILLLVISLFTWNPLVLFITDVSIISTIWSFFSKKKTAI